MTAQGKNTVTQAFAKILLVDDEEKFRLAMKRQLEVREYTVLDVDNGEDAIKNVRHENPEVVILDQKIPKMDGIQILKEIKKMRPEAQVIMLTGYGSAESARGAGKYDVFHYMQKPCVLSDLVEVIEAARRERLYAMARHEIPHVKRGSFMRWLIGAHNARPGYILVGVLLFLAIIGATSPQRLTTLVSMQKVEESAAGQDIVGYAEYLKMKPGQTIADYYSDKAGFTKTITREDGAQVKVPLTPLQTSFRARVMIGILVMAALFWATGAIPVGVTAILVGMLMYFFEVLPPDKVAAAYAKDSVIFIFGVLAISSAISKTGLDRRIGLLLLGSSSSLARLALIFAPLLAISASFLSEHALVAFIAPILILVYGGAVRAAGIKKDRNLAVMLILMLTFVANVGGPGSPAAGGRNAVMLGILSDYGISLPFAQWVKLGLPTVPALALAISMYFYLVFRKKLKVKDLDVAAQVRKESQKIGKMTPNEYKTAAVLLLLITLWSTVSGRYGMGGPVLLCLVLLNVLGILRWRDINQIHWDVVALYASASAMGVGLAGTGGALWMADGFMRALPDSMKSGAGLCVGASLFSGVITNFMSDGATVAAIGPITVPMATLSGASPIAVGLATAFASSFAFMLVIGTPNNAIAYAMAKDPETGEQLVTTQDFLVHGAVALALSFLVLWGWTFFGYWRWMGM